MSLAWKKISAVIFQKPAPETSEVFVRRVMSRIEAMEPRPRVRYAPARWFFAPALGIAAMLLLTLRPSLAPVLPEDAWLVGAPADTADELLEFVMGTS